MQNILEWLRKHHNGLSCFIAGVCVQAGLFELAHHDYTAAIINFVIAGVNIYFYNIEQV